MTLKEIEDNISAVACALANAKDVDTNSIMLLTIAQSLIVIIKSMQDKDGQDDTRNKLKI